MGASGSSAFLVCDGEDPEPDFFLITSHDRVFRLDTGIELLTLIVWIKAQVDAVAREEHASSTTCGLRLLLEHPQLDWVLLTQDEWMERSSQATS